MIVHLVAHLPDMFCMIAVQDIARQQVQAAWNSKPKIDVYLNLQAPKIAIPIKQQNASAGPVTFLADLGSLIISSNHVESSILSPEEAALYDCYALVSSDLSAHLINGDFRWPEVKQHTVAAPSAAATPQTTPAGLARPSPHATTVMSVPRHEAAEYLGDGAVAVRVLDHCSTSASVHMAHVSHPNLPLVRIGLQVRSLGFSALSKCPLVCFENVFDGVQGAARARRISGC
jgi:hypothetical protein